jgi:biopolymer transport protein ExbB
MQDTWRKSLILGVCVLAGTVAGTALAKVPTFEEAFARELNELQETQIALQSSLETFEKTLEQQKSKLEGEIKQAESSLLVLKRRGREQAAMRDSLAEKELVSEDHGAVLRALLAGARASQAAPDASSPPASGDTAASFLAAVNTATKEMDAGSRLHIATGTFFGPDGKQVRGRIAHVGDIAALGLSENTGGVLLKLEGGYRVLDESARSEAEQLVAGERPREIDVFLFSPECTGHDPTQGNSFVAMLNKGGPVAWVIMCLALLGLLLVCERFWTLSRLTNWGTGRFEDVAARLQADDFQGACALTNRMGAVGKVLRGVIERRHMLREELEKQVSETVLKAMPPLERSLTILVVITAVAPLLGLLGTVTGMISTFNVITEFGTGDPKLLSGGISEALITTKLGLSVAVPFLLIRSLIARWSDRIIENMQTYALATMNILFNRGGLRNE